MRLIILFAGPFEDDIDWKLIAGDPQRRPGVNAWLGRVFAAVDEAVRGPDVEPEALRRLTHRTIKGVTEDIERFRFNTAISKLQVLTNEMRTTLDGGEGALGAARALTLLLAPFAPYAAEELWRTDLGEASSVHTSSWPAFDSELVVEKTVTMVIQVDGRVRDRIEVAADADESDCLTAARTSAGAQRAMTGRRLVKEIVRPPKLVNFVTSD
jgi:leucyl-tRNA synthetase